MEFEKGSNAKLENFRGKGRIEKNGKVDSFRCVGEKLKKKKNKVKAEHFRCVERWKKKRRSVQGHRRYDEVGPSKRGSSKVYGEGVRRIAAQIKKTQDELQWIVAQRLLSALTTPGFR